VIQLIFGVDGRAYGDRKALTGANAQPVRGGAIGRLVAPPRFGTEGPSWLRFAATAKRVDEADFMSDQTKAIVYLDILGMC
jgi:hypothetical protein